MKKKIAAIAGLVAFALAGQSAFAKTLEDVLKEKGVITEEDYKEVTKFKPVDYKIGKGFTFTSQDEKFQLSLGSRLQVRYTFTDNDGDSKTGTAANDTSEWRIRRMKVFMNGHAFTKDLTFKTQFNFASAGSNNLLEDAILNYKVLGLNELQILAGQEKVSFARQELTSSGAQQFVDRSNATDTFKPARDIGLMLHGKVLSGIFNYNLGIYNGAGQSQLRASNGAGNTNALSARFAVNPLGDMPYSEADLEHSPKPLVSLGGSYYNNTLRKVSATAFETVSSNLNYAANFLKPGVFNATEKVDIDLFGIDAAFKWMGASLQAEYFLAQADGQDSGSIQRGHGFYAQAGYFIIPKHLEAAIRYSYADRDRDAANDLRREVQGAISYYFNKHNLKIQGDISNIHNQATNGSDDMQYRLQAQVIF